MRRSIAGLLLVWGTLLLATCGPRPETTTSVAVPTPDVPATLTAIPAPDVVTPPAITATAAGTSASGGSPLAAYTNCIVCHDLHAETVVSMPHPENPSCNACHSGSPRKMGCPSCHSTHLIRAPHENDPNLACVTCHSGQQLPPVPATP